MKLSEAIRLGAMLKPQARHTLDDGKATCALGAAYEAQPGVRRTRWITGPLDINGGAPFRGERSGMGEYVSVIETPSEWRVMWATVACPMCQIRDSGDRIIPHLNDVHRWTREQIADFVATIEAQHEQPSQPQPVSVEAV